MLPQQQEPPTDTAKPTICIVGAGALGSYYGARLLQHGHDVHLLLRSDYAHVKQHGLNVQSRDGDFRLSPEQVRVYDDPHAMPRADLVIVTLKTTANAHLQGLIEPLLHDGTGILTLQNGLENEQILARLFGNERVMGGMAFICTNRVAPGEIRHTDHGLIRMGELNRPMSSRLARIVEMFNTSKIKAQALDDLNYGRWEKLVWNIPFNGLGAAMDLATDGLLANDAGRQLVADLMREVVRAANANGAALPESVIDFQINRTPSMGPYRTSMQIDRQQGRPLEVEAILGEPLRAAERAGVPTPILQVLYRQVKALDRS